LKTHANASDKWHKFINASPTLDTPWTGMVCRYIACPKFLKLKFIHLVAVFANIRKLGNIFLVFPDEGYRGTDI
jgi:hypothetical protein